MNLERESARLYAGLLHLYPARFRRRYGAEMQTDFADLCREAARRGGAWAVLRLWPPLLADVLMNSLAEHLTGGYPMIRRWLDLTLSLGMVCIGLSMLPLVALLIKLDSPGPVFYAGTRLGKDGRPFRLFKLRTMMPVGDGSQRQITRVGSLLRRTYLDEWPSFLNVLRGEMTLIGPRPQSLERRTGEEPLTVTPGMLPTLLRLHQA